MTKTTKFSIAAALLALHLLLFGILFSRPGNDLPTPAAPPPTPSSTAIAPQVAPIQLNIPNNITLPPPSVIDTPAPSTAPVKHGPHITTPRNQPGYLSNNLPPQHPNKVFTNLKRTPYNGALVVDAYTGKILFQDRPNQPCYPASITKLMTMLIVLDYIDQGKISLNDAVKIDKAACAVGGSQVFLDPRETFKVNDLLNALMIHSANDAAAALAIYTAGSTDAFVKLMNAKARKLGMNATTYQSPHGLPPGKGKQPDISTPHDIALLSLAALQHEKTLQYTSTYLTYLPLTPLRKEKTMLVNRNELVNQKNRDKGYPGCDGLKTGYHFAGGFSLTATAERGSHRIIAVLLGCSDKKTRNATAKMLLDKGFQALGVPPAQ